MITNGFPFIAFLLCFAAGMARIALKNTLLPSMVFLMLL